MQTLWERSANRNGALKGTYMSIVSVFFMKPRFKKNFMTVSTFTVHIYTVASF